MRRLRNGLTQVLLAVLGLTACEAQQQAAATSPPPFDYWVLALSWSPEFCATNPEQRQSRQCRQSREFIVHGLWPQFERGYPEYCDTRQRVDERTADRLAPLVPDRGLVFHQWKKHGSCSGLDPERYFSTMERAWQALSLPEATLDSAAAANSRIGSTALEQAFAKANPGFGPASIAVQCGRGGYLRELRLCLDHGLKPRDCGTDVRDTCGRDVRIRKAGAPS